MAHSRTASRPSRRWQGGSTRSIRGCDMDYPDVKRAERFIAELSGFEQAGEMPRMQVLRLPNDHTSGTRVGKPTVTAMVADNDLALGMVVEAVSKSKFWKETGDLRRRGRRPERLRPRRCPPHRGPGRSALHQAATTWTRTLYSTSSMLRTMELILGLQPMSQFDAAARPMFNSFTAEARR